MPVAKPTALPRWADQASAQILEPNEGKKGVGWVPGEEPPAPYFNWWQRLVYTWIQWLNALLDQPNTWSAPQTFHGAIVAGGPSGSPQLAVIGSAGASTGTGPGIIGSDGADMIGGVGASSTSAPGGAGGAALVGRGGNGGSGTVGGAGGSGLHGIGGLGGAGGSGGSGGSGVVGDGAGNAPGVQANGGATGPGLATTAGGGNAPQRGALALVPQQPPSTPLDGDLWMDLSVGGLRTTANGKTDTIPTKSYVDVEASVTLAQAEAFALANAAPTVLVFGAQQLPNTPNALVTMPPGYFSGTPQLSTPPHLPMPAAGKVTSLHISNLYSIGPTVQPKCEVYKNGQPRLRRGAG